MDKLEPDIEHLVNILKKSENIVVFTGAGISTESGIADYRSKGGLWDRFKPVTIQEFEASEEKRREYWVIKKELMESLQTAKPNAGHLAIAELERRGKLKGLVTQNIDGLHSLAGNSKEKTIEIHGTNLETICWTCKDIRPWQEAFEQLKSGATVPVCSQCAGPLKANTISFGQNLRQDDLDQAFSWASDCDFMMAIGSTLIVEPAASIPKIAKRNGAVLAIITLSETPLDAIADFRFFESSGKILNNILKRI